MTKYIRLHVLIFRKSIYVQKENTLCHVLPCDSVISKKTYTKSSQPKVEQTCTKYKAEEIMRNFSKKLGTTEVTHAQSLIIAFHNT